MPLELAVDIKATVATLKSTVEKYGVMAKKMALASEVAKMEYLKILRSMVGLSKLLADNMRPL